VAEVSAVKDLIVEHVQDVSPCYDEALERTPGLDGRVVLRLVAEAGQFIDVNWLEDDTHDDIFVTCIEDKLIGLESNSDFSGEITWPFLLRAKVPEDEGE
jgi:hypothetical protein